MGSYSLIGFTEFRNVSQTELSYFYLPVEIPTHSRTPQVQVKMKMSFIVNLYASFQKGCRDTYKEWKIPRLSINDLPLQIVLYIPI